MPQPAKLVQVLGLLGKEEATYGNAVALTTTADGVQLQFENRDYPWVQLNYTFDGDLGPSVGNLGTVLRAGKTGRSFTYEAPTRAKGGGAAYTASVVPSIHRLLKASGFDAAVTTTSAAEKWTYTPTGPGTTYTSLTMEFYGRGEKVPAVGVIADWRFEFANGGPPTHTFVLNGFLSADISDAAFPSITYPLTSVQAPLANGVALTLGSFTANAVMYSGGFTLNRELFPRVALTSAGGHQGFIPRGRAPEMRFVVEATALQGTPFHAAGGIDPYKLEEAATSIQAKVAFGSTQYNRWNVNFPQAQVTAVAPTIVNGVACVDLTVRAHTSTPAAADDITVTFD